MAPILQTQTSIFIIVMALLIAIGIVSFWWVIVEQPKSIFDNVLPPLPCPTSNPNNQDPKAPCVPARNILRMTG